MVDDRPAGFACGQNWQTKWTLLEVFFGNLRGSRESFLCIPGGLTSKFSCADLM